MNESGLIFGLLDTFKRNSTSRNPLMNISEYERSFVLKGHANVQLIQHKIYLLNDYYVLGTMLDLENAKLTKKCSQRRRPHSVIRRQTHKQMTLYNGINSKIEVYTQGFTIKRKTLKEILEW